METQNRKKIIDIYKGSLEKNLKDICEILKDSNLYSHQFLASYKTVLEKTSGKITKKWKRGDKYLRTEFVLQAFAQYYPTNFLELSIEIDAMINILDDLLDESLNKEDKIAYVLEYLRIFSAYCLNKSNANFQTNMGYYFNKLITLALAEQRLLALATKESSLNTIVKLSNNLLLLRSHDIDIFIEMAQSAYNERVGSKSAVIAIGRAFRAVNILKKDMFDLERDKKQGQETLITLMISQDKFSFRSYINRLITIFENETNKIESKLKTEEQKILVPIRHFKQMLSSDKKEIHNYLNINSNNQ